MVASSACVLISAVFVMVDDVPGLLSSRALVLDIFRLVLGTHGQISFK